MLEKLSAVSFALLFACVLSMLMDMYSCPLSLVCMWFVSLLNVLYEFFLFA